MAQGRQGQMAALARRIGRGELAAGSGGSLDMSDWVDWEAPALE
ncbi:hypothetical protein [Sorangium sp. So ce854]